MPVRKEEPLMATQTVIWTALPNGIVDDAAGRRLRLSVLVSPRLRLAAAEGEALAQFPDFVVWPARILAASFEVVFDGGPTLAAVTSSPPPEPDLWSALFGAETFVQPYAFDDHSQRQIVSYPVQRVLDTLKRQYRRLGLDSADRLPNARHLMGALDDFAMEWNLDTEAIARDSLGRGQDVTTREAMARLFLFHHP